jgi:hypothetical protein
MSWLTYFVNIGPPFFNLDEATHHLGYLIDFPLLGNPAWEAGNVTAGFAAG